MSLEFGPNSERITPRMNPNVNYRLGDNDVIVGSSVVTDARFCWGILIMEDAIHL